MNFYTVQHEFYCGTGLHARKMYLCILDAKGEVKLHRNMNSDREAFLKAIEPEREDVVVAVECMFAWYWIADLCQKEGIAFVLGHALMGSKLGEFWKYRVGDYRIITQIQDEKLLVLVLRIGYRRTGYSR